MAASAQVHEDSNSSTSTTISDYGPYLAEMVGKPSEDLFESISGDDRRKGLFRSFLWNFCPQELFKKEADKWEEDVSKQNPWFFRLTMIGSTVGLGNAWRFPYLVARYGGGAFIFAYLLVFLTVAYPLLFLEISLGQFSGKKHLKVFSSICPILIGLGWAAIIVTFIGTSSYSAIFSWCLFYMFSSARSPLMWSSYCRSPNTTCFTLEKYEDCVKNSPDARWFLKGQCYNSTSIGEFFKEMDSCIQDQTENEKCSIQLEFEFSGRQDISNKFGNKDWDRILQSFAKMYDRCRKQFVDLSERYHVPEHKRFNLRIDMAGSDRKSVMRSVKSHGINLTNLALKYCGIRTVSINCARMIVRAHERFSSREYFNSILSDYSAQNAFYWPLPLVLFFAWFIAGLALLGGLRSLGRIVYFTATFPFFLMFIFTMYGVVLDAKADYRGNTFFLDTEWCTLTDKNLWMDALVQAFYTSGLGIIHMLRDNF